MEEDTIFKIYEILINDSNKYIPIIQTLDKLICLANTIDDTSRYIVLLCIIYIQEKNIKYITDKDVKNIMEICHLLPKKKIK